MNPVSKRRTDIRGEETLKPFRKKSYNNPGNEIEPHEELVKSKR